MTLTHGSLFSGVGGMDIGFDAAGIETLWQCELDAKPRSVLAKHWPNATRYIDVKDADGSKVKPVDIISFGSPCQDLSIAGKRAGLAGSRSGLYHQAIRVIKEMRDATQNQYPRVAIWENVRGAFSSNDGADFHEALQALADIGAVDISWRLVNACNFGVPQRRLRVFVVATFGEERAGEILAQPTRLLWHPKPSGETGQETAGEVEDSTESGGWTASRSVAHAITQHIKSGADDNFAQGGHIAFRMLGFGDYKQDTTASTVKQRDYKDSTDLVVNDSEVRRLTPRECERLMGWPDDHTRYDDKGNELSDSARYKMCGNGIASPVAQWIGENIVKAYNA